MGFGEILCEIGRNGNDYNGTFGKSIRGVQSTTFTARDALEFKASLRSNLSMKLYVLLLMESNELSCAEGTAVTVDWSFDVTERHPLEAEVSRRDAAEDPLYQGSHSSLTNNHSANCSTINV